MEFSLIIQAPSLRHTYTHYVNNYDQALKTMNWCLQKESAFAFFLEVHIQSCVETLRIASLFDVDEGTCSLTFSCLVL
jgi:hypothetical protein